MPQILHISIYGAKTEAVTSARIASLERVSFVLSFDVNNSILFLCGNVPFTREGHIMTFKLADNRLVYISALLMYLIIESTK